MTAFESENQRVGAKTTSLFGNERVEATPQEALGHVSTTCAPFSPTSRLSDITGSTREETTRQLRNQVSNQTVSTAWGSKISFTKTVIEASNERVVYNGGSGAPIFGFTATFRGLDGGFMPVRDENGVFRIKWKKCIVAKHLMVADRPLMLVPYPDTHPEGVMTFLPGWDHDVSRRFRVPVQVTSHTCKRRSPVFERDEGYRRRL